MTRLFAAVLKGCRALQWIAGASLVFLMLLTICDVLLRAFGRPIPGTFELVGFAGGIAIGLAMPFTSWVRGHVFVDTFLERLPKGGRMAGHVVTRLLAMVLFTVLGWNLVRFGLDLRASGEVSLTLELPFYPLAFGLAAASFVQVAVLLCDIAISVRGGHE